MMVGCCPLCDRIAENDCGVGVFKAFEGALESLEAAKLRVSELRERGVAAITVKQLPAVHQCVLEIGKGKTGRCAG